ncbi:NAD-dependent epimerase/dehydratase family protein [Candidatus Daviesbacteria bacterium]|nr:NAD-dependent epimerase/dehydratase family protein [Candidatus Daviesbacteria bacterium]
MKHQDMVLVTGGAGFIGSHLVDALINKGFRVRVLDNLSRPTHDGKIPDWLNNTAEFIRGDVRIKKDWIKALSGVGVVFHLASYMDYHPDFSRYFDTNVKSTALLYEIVVGKKLPVKKIIVASSQSVYGEGKYTCPGHGVFYARMRSETQLKKHEWEVCCPKDGKAAEILPEFETDELSPQSPYAVSKLASEKLCQILGQTYRIPSIALRYSIVLGERQSFRHFYSGALRDFCVRAMAGLEILTHEDAMQIRDFVNIHDVTQAHLLVLESKKADYQVLNVGSGRTSRIIDLANTVCNAAKIIHKPLATGKFRINSPRNSVMSIGKLKKLGYKPKYDLKDSVFEYLHWIQGYPEAISYLKKTYAKMHKEGILKP